MRNLTIKRTKKFTACLFKLHVYIEDPSSNEITINNTPCRHIGDLKNGEQKTFLIDDHAARVFVIADKLSKEYCNDYFSLPEGQEDIFLSGENKFNLFNGHAFRFDNNENEDVIEHRQKTTCKGLPVFITATIVGILIGILLNADLFFNLPAEDKTFTSNGMSVTLTEDFEESSFEDITAVYGSEHVAVFALKEDFTAAPGLETYKTLDYTKMFIESKSWNIREINQDNGLTSFEYDYINPETKDSYHYYTFVYKATDAFWVIQFATKIENIDQYQDQIIRWAQSVTFTT